MVWGDRVRPIARAGSSVEPIVIDEYAVEPAEDPVIGPELAAARTRLGLTVDQLAERTRIRPHVIESIEVDDFAPCGGDFYARGHLRTLARVLGIDVTPLLTALRRAVRRRPDQPAPGLRGRAGHRRPRLDPRHPRRAELVGADRRRDGAWCWSGRSPGWRMDDPDLNGAAPDPQRLAGHRQPLPAGRRPGAGAAHRRGRRHPRPGARRLRATRCSRATWPSARAGRCSASPPGPGAGLRRLAPGQPRRQGPRHRRRRGPARQEHLRLPLTGQLRALRATGQFRQSARPGTRSAAMPGRHLGACKCPVGDGGE